ncbi:MAG: hypothetical protein R2806_18685 [Saprospiraceae bacterium]
MEKITIIGLGHIGGSFAKDIREHGLAHTLIGVESIPNMLNWPWIWDWLTGWKRWSRRSPGRT